MTGMDKAIPEGSCTSVRGRVLMRGRAFALRRDRQGGREQRRKRQAGLGRRRDGAWSRPGVVQAGRQGGAEWQRWLAVRTWRRNRRRRVRRRVDRRKRGGARGRASRTSPAAERKRVATRVRSSTSGDLEHATACGNGRGERNRSSGTRQIRGCTVVVAGQLPPVSLDHIA
jgi:hypothetical protein